MIDLKPNKYLGDVAARNNVGIDIRQDGLVIWVHIDGICAARILTNGMIPIEVTDNRKNSK